MAAITVTDIAVPMLVDGWYRFRIKSRNAAGVYSGPSAWTPWVYVSNGVIPAVDALTLTPIS